MRDAVDAAASGAHGNRRAGEQPVSDEAARRRTALRRFRENFGGPVPGPSAGFFEDGRGRRSRVVLAPVAGVKSRGGDIGPTGRRMPSIREATVAKRNSSPGRARRKPLKPLRREGRMIGHTCGSRRVLFCCTRAMGASWHPAFPAPSCFSRDKVLAKLGRDRCRGNEDLCQPSRRGPSFETALRASSG